jgi:hypothetical protein
MSGRVRSAFALTLSALFFAAGSGGARADTPAVAAYELFAHVTAYHDAPGDAVNGGRLNYMGYRLQAGYSAAGPPALVGAIVEIPDFDPVVFSTSVSRPLRRFIRSRGYTGLFVIDDIGRDITFLHRGRRAYWQPDWSLAKLSEHSLRTGEAVVDIDVMIPRPELAASYINRKCRIVIYETERSGFRWVPSRSPVWGGSKPVFDTVERFRRYVPLLEGLRESRSWTLASFYR